MQKCNGLCCFDKVMLEGHIHLTAFKKTFFGKQSATWTVSVDMNRDGFCEWS